MLNPMTNPNLHKKDCGFFGPCDCDAHRLNFLQKLLRLAGVR